MLKTLQTIKEEEEHDNEAMVYTMEMQALGLSSPSKRKRGTMRSSGRGSSFIETDMVPIQIETEEQRAEREKQEFKKSFKVLSKEEAKEEMQRNNFKDFLNKTARIVERALDNDFDVVGDFFTIDDDEGL